MRYLVMWHYDDNGCKYLIRLVADAVAVQPLSTDNREKYREKPIYRGKNLGRMHQIGRFLAVFRRDVSAKITGKQNYGNREKGGQKQGKGGPPA
jgi:hypothetical protein